MNSIKSFVKVDFAVGFDITLNGKKKKKNLSQK